MLQDVGDGAALRKRLDGIAEIAGSLFRAPMAAVSVAEAWRLGAAKPLGLPADLPLECLLQIAPEAMEDGLFGVSDATFDGRVARHPLVAGPPFIRSAVLAPLVWGGATPRGVLVVADTGPRVASRQELRALRELATIATEALQRAAGTAAGPLAGPDADGANRLIATLRLEQKRMTDYVAAAADVMWETDRHLVMAADRGRYPVTGRGFELVHGVNMLDTLQPEDMSREQFAELWQALTARQPFRGIEFASRLPDGRLMWLEINGVPYFGDDGAFLGYRGITRNITRRKQAEQRVQRMAGEDELTGLQNRRAFRAALEEALTAGRSMALLMLDLDGFKQVNDTLGHAAGDAVLVETALRLRRCLREGDSAARLGGDEFAVLTHESGREALERILARVAEDLGRPVVLAGAHVRIGASIGIALLPADAPSPEAAIKAADMALYAAKRQQRGCWRFHSDSKDTKAAPAAQQ